jgi:hypothetical protein
MNNNNNRIWNNNPIILDNKMVIINRYYKKVNNNPMINKVSNLNLICNKKKKIVRKMIWIHWLKE